MRAGYDRARDLPKLLRLWPDEALSLAAKDPAALVEKLARMLRAERKRSQSRHWGYDLSRHAALMLAYQCEREDLAKSETKSRRMLAAPSQRQIGGTAGSGDRPLLNGQT